ncbi:hypothetical protein LPJ56_003396 [Coemansia sp. RSA 2599]|nr:hypothetical protein LPJ75_003161 [Coemansia sp. RSA 2598]KAJ1820628.1 hypothetical protein LPJ56_003396 [Coemansia sp. RSA 2599]
MAREYPHMRFVLNGGVDTAQAALEHLQRVDGVMIGRKVREDPWFLSELDQYIYSQPPHAVPRVMDVLDEYLRFADHMHSEYAMRYTRLARPLYALFAGKKGKAFRRNLGHSLAQAKSTRECSAAETESSYKVQFSEVVAEAVHSAEKEHAQSAKMASSVYANAADDDTCVDRKIEQQKQQQQQAI